jgi:DNA-binding response OmpR family regulator
MRRRRFRGGIAAAIGRGGGSGSQRGRLVTVPVSRIRAVAVRYRGETRPGASFAWRRIGRSTQGRERQSVRVLVIEDDEELATAIATGLRRSRMAVDVALDGLSGLDRALTNGYDVVVLDRDLPGLHGDEVCAELVAAGSRCRVLMLTAAATTNAIVDGLGRGADDYLAKPFDFSELVARIGALARRSQPAVPPVLAQGDVALDTTQRLATRAGRRLDLTPKEFGVLELLLASQGRVVSAEELLERVWDESADPFTQAVKITVSRLRAKLGDPPIIETVPQAGYRI